MNFPTGFFKPKVNLSCRVSPGESQAEDLRPIMITELPSFHVNGNWVKLISQSRYILNFPRIAQANSVLPTSLSLAPTIIMPGILIISSPNVSFKVLMTRHCLRSFFFFRDIFAPILMASFIVRPSKFCSDPIISSIF